MSKHCILWSHGVLEDLVELHDATLAVWEKCSAY